MFRVLSLLTGRAEDRAARQGADPHSTLDDPPAPARTRPEDPAPTCATRPDVLWDLEAEFLRSLDEFEHLMTAVIASRLGAAIAEHLTLSDTLAFLEDLAVLRSPDRTRWATCLGVRSRLLLGEGDDRPGQQELRHSLTIMKDLHATVSSQGNENLHEAEVDQLSIRVTDVMGDPVHLEIVMRKDTVGICCGNWAAVFIRDELRTWLKRPEGQFGSHSVTWNSTGKDVVISIQILFVSYRLRPGDLSMLRLRI